MLRYLSIFLILSFLSFKDFALSEKKEVAGDLVQTIAINEKHILNTPLPIGSKIILTDFPKEVPLENKELSTLLNDLSVYVDTMNNRTTSKCFVSEIPIQYHYYEQRDLLSDYQPDRLENVFTLPKKNGFDITIEKVSNTCNDNVKLPVQYCLTVRKGDKYIKRYNIGYTHYGSLSSTTKHWYIDKHFIIHTRIVADVAGNEETYVHKVKKYILTDKGDLVDYFDKSVGKYEDKEESGLINNHMKNGFWIEKKTNYGYLNAETYVKGEYSNGLPIGKWEYFDLETIEEVSDEGYVINTITKKGTTLLMIEEYSNNGELIKREIID